MNEQQQRIAIAEWMGIVECDENAWTPLIAGASMIKSAHCSHTKCVPVGCFPNYPNNLNAMHEAEKRLSDEQFSEYVRVLMFSSLHNNAGKHNRSFLSSTSQKRSEALCRTLWPERFEK